MTETKVRNDTRVKDVAISKIYMDCFASRLPENLFGEQVGSQ